MSRTPATPARHRKGAARPRRIDTSLDPLLTEFGRDVYRTLTDCADRLAADTAAGQHVQQRIEVGLTRAARSTVQACLQLDPVQLGVLVEHARRAGLIQKRTTGAAYALLRIACGLTLQASKVSRAATLCCHILEQKLDLDEVLPERAAFWRVFELYCGKNRSAKARDRLTLAIDPDITARIKAGDTIQLNVAWDTEARVAVGRELTQEKAGDALAETARTPLQLLIGDESSSTRVPPLVFGRADELPNGDRDTAIDSAVVDQAIKPQPDLLQPPLAKGSSDLQPEGETQHYTFRDNMRGNHEADFRQLKAAGIWQKITVGGKSISVWSGKPNDSTRQLIASHGATRVTPDARL
jgi:hypothetical protein